MTVIGPDALEILDAFQYEEAANSKDIEKVLYKFEEFCIGTTNEIYEGYCFNKREQFPDESFDTYLSALRSMSKSCNFGTLEESLIRDRIVVGIKENSVRKRLLQESKLTLKDTIDICKSSETTSKQLKAMNSDDVAFVSLCQHKTYKTPDKKKLFKPQSKDEKFKKQAIPECSCCGLKHVRKKHLCPAWGKVCAKCHLKNHFASKCTTKSEENKGQKKYHKRKPGLYSVEEAEE